MKAIVVTSLGGPEGLSLKDVADPAAAPGEVLIKVYYSGINYAETLVRRGVIPGPPPPFVMGLEVVGTVEAVGDGVEGFRLGQPVAAFSSKGYAQYTTVKAEFVAPLDLRDHAVDLEQAIGVPCTGVTAYQLLTLVGRLQGGDTVFVQGAAGGVGTMLGQQARALGAGRIIGSVGSAAKADFARAQGYDDAIERDGFLEQIKALTEGRGVDLFFEGISGANLANPETFLAPLGRAVYFGDTNFSSDTEIAIKKLRSGSWTLSGYSLGGLCVAAPARWKPSALAVLKMMAQGAIGDVAVTLFPPDEAKDAHQRLESRQSQGKLAFDWTSLNV